MFISKESKDGNFLKICLFHPSRGILTNERRPRKFCHHLSSVLYKGGQKNMEMGKEKVYLFKKCKEICVQDVHSSGGFICFDHA
jgi:hypothetical protein